jgi:hypothetical protein
MISQEDDPRRCLLASPMENEFLLCGASGPFWNCLKLQLLDAKASEPHTASPLAVLIRVLRPERDMLSQCLF